MRKGMIAGAVCLCCLAALPGNASQAPAAKPADKLVFPNNGFAIAPLDQPGEGANQVLFMFLPASAGFAPNVNVQTQKYAGTIEEYAAVSKKQFEDGQLKIISTAKPDKATAVFEYSGQMEGKALHWYARAALRNGAIYLITATALEDQWKDASAKLKSCVDSFELIDSRPKPQPM